MPYADAESKDPSWLITRKHPPLRYVEVDALSIIFIDDYQKVWGGSGACPSDLLCN